MGNTIQLTCGHCGKRAIMPDGEAGVIYTCPHCSGQNRAARVVQETAPISPATQEDIAMNGHAIQPTSGRAITSVVL